ncbi:DUF427-domain-containing protein [Artomyces pyxidatus]|uniref:DUF427-domain-containing protein n=1 Tax=Artomyces pyxidatus TaxID=48021 RepID=A0ACB8T0T2_9AGAM|nr:DUF427-domain-containing protein [Artomyces pyxidatus]
MSKIPFPFEGYNEPSPKRIRVLFGGDIVVDTTNALLVWEHVYYPQYYFHKSDVTMTRLKPSTTATAADSSSEIFDLVMGARRATEAAVVYHSGPLADLVKIEFDKADAWFEEEEEIFVHPKDPYKRVDVIQSARHVRVEVEGIVLADTQKPRLLYETGLPVRTYIPKTDVRLDLLEHADLTSACPYKGVAAYYDVNVPSGKKEGIVWWYRNPTLECADVKGYVAFYDEKVDVFVDDVKVERPKTHF